MIKGNRMEATGRRPSMMVSDVYIAQLSFWTMETRGSRTMAGAFLSQALGSSLTHPRRQRHIIYGWTTRRGRICRVWFLQHGQ